MNIQFLTSLVYCTTGGACCWCGMASLEFFNERMSQRLTIDEVEYERKK